MGLEKKGKIILLTLLILIITSPLHVKEVKLIPDINNNGHLEIIYTDGFMRIYGEGTFVEVLLEDSSMIKYKADSNSVEAGTQPIKIRYVGFLYRLKEEKSGKKREFLRKNSFNLNKITITYPWDKIRFKSEVSI